MLEDIVSGNGTADAALPDLQSDTNSDSDSESDSDSVDSSHEASSSSATSQGKNMAGSKHGDNRNDVSVPAGNNKRGRRRPRKRRRRDKSDGDLSALGIKKGEELQAYRAKVIEKNERQRHKWVQGSNKTSLRKKSAPNGSSIVAPGLSSIHRSALTAISDSKDRRKKIGRQERHRMRIEAMRKERESMRQLSGR